MVICGANASIFSMVILIFVATPGLAGPSVDDNADLDQTATNSATASETPAPSPRKNLGRKDAIEKDDNGAPGSRDIRGPLLLPRELAEILRLTKAGMGENVIVAYIKKFPYDYAISPNQIISLNQVGVSQKVIAALLEHKGFARRPPGGPMPFTSPEASFGAPTSAYIPGPPPLPVDMSFQEFYTALRQYGQWYNVPGLGWCWQPKEAANDPRWQPYVDNGYWLMSNQGWYWNSGYSWGWAPFHYGRWGRRPRLGWFWRPDTDWSPGWVCWRQGADFCGWAPLPPGSAFSRPSGWTFNGSAVGSDCEFGLGSEDFSYVALRHFTDPNWVENKLEAPAAELFKDSHSENKFSFAAANRVANWGLRPETLRSAGVEVIPRVNLVDRRLFPNLALPGNQFVANDAPPPTPVAPVLQNTPPIGQDAPPSAGFTPDMISPQPVTMARQPAPPQMFDVGGSGGFGGGWDSGIDVGAAGGPGGVSWGGGSWSGGANDWQGSGNWNHHHHQPPAVPPTHVPGSDPASTATPWLPVGGQLPEPGLPPYGTYGVRAQPSGGAPWSVYQGNQPVPAPQPWPTPQPDLAGAPDYSAGLLYKPSPQNASTRGTLGYGTIGKGVLAADPRTLSAMGPYAAYGGTNPQRGGAAWGTFGVQPSAGGPPFGTYGSPIIANDGRNPYLPFMGYGSGSAHGYGSVPRTGFGAGFRYLPGAPILPQAPQLPSPPIWPSFSYLGRGPGLWQSAPSVRSAPSSPPVAGRFGRGGGFHGGARVGGGGAAVLGGGGGGRASGGGGGGGGSRR